MYVPGSSYYIPPAYPYYPMYPPIPPVPYQDPWPPQGLDYHSNQGELL